MIYPCRRQKHQGYQLHGDCIVLGLLLRSGPSEGPRYGAAFAAIVAEDQATVPLHPGAPFEWTSVVFHRIYL